MGQREQALHARAERAWIELRQAEWRRAAEEKRNPEIRLRHEAEQNRLAEIRRCEELGQLARVRHAQPPSHSLMCLNSYSPFCACTKGWR